MTKLEQLYNSIQNLKELGVKLPEKLIEETNRVEEEIIKNEVIPTLGKNIEPIISQIQRELTLVIEYVPSEPLQVKMTRKRSFKFSEEEEPYVKLESSKKEVSYTITPHTKSKKTNLIITFPDGVELSNKFAYQTFCQAIQKIGVKTVSEIGLKQNGIPLISKVKDDFYQQHQIDGGYYILTHSSTEQKKKHIQQICKMLKIKIKTKII